MKKNQFGPSLGLALALGVLIAVGIFASRDSRFRNAASASTQPPVTAAADSSPSAKETTEPRLIASHLKPRRLPDIDVRRHAASKGAAKRAAGAAALRARVPGVRIDHDELTASPKNIVAVGRFLTPAAGGDAAGGVSRFVEDNTALFGHGPAMLGKDNSRVVRDDTTAHSGMRTLVWQQSLDGIPLFNTILKANVSKNGEIASIGSHYLADPAAASGLTPARRTAAIAEPEVNAPKAISLAVASLNDEVPVEGVIAQGQPEGAERKQRFAAPKLSDTSAQLTWMPMSADEVKLAWDVTTFSLTRNEMFRTVVDAASGEVLYRVSLTDDISNASYRVYADATTLQAFDSPSPMSPGLSTPASTQPSEVARQLVTTQAQNTTASPNGWINDGGQETLGNNVDAHTDLNADNIADTPRPNGGASRVFDFTMNTTLEPTTYRDAAVTQLFYLNNWMHDKLYALGFTESAGNFQTDNFGRGGNGNDAVQADAQDGSGTNNANFSTPSDGSAGRMQMYIFPGPAPDRDGDFDAEIVLHEYTHGLSNRLVGGGVGMSALQSRGMGEGWSDFYGLCLLSQAGDNVDGNYAAGGYATYQLSGLTSNYYYGIRHYPYTTDMSKNPVTFRDIDPTQSSAHTGIPASPIFSSIASNPTEVHNQGEIWCATLWEVRRNLVVKHGFAVGNQLMLQLATDGMKLAPVNPNMLQARDAIVQADLVATGGANRREIWQGFAKRGMGASATSPASSSTTGVVEAFDVPDDLSITPTAAVAATGPTAGPFNPASQTYTLTNTNATTALTWTAAASQPWLSVSPSGGTLAAGASTTVTMAFNSAATALAVGAYSGTVNFNNLVSGVQIQRAVSLTKGSTDYFTELFDTSTNDTDNQSWLFTPNGSGSYYGVAKSFVTSFPTDPTGGTALSLSADSYLQVTPGVQVALYGTSYSSFYVSSKGYVTFGSGEFTWTETLAAHFAKPRIAALFDDLDPSLSGGSVSWKQLADRIAVTYQNVQAYGGGGSNSFQIEMYFDGRIRITCLGISNTGGLIGLSRGLGTPAGFIESDFSAYGSGSSSLALQLAAPATATEGDGVLAGQGTVTLSAAQATSTVVTLASSNTGEVTVPATVTVPANQLSQTFDVTIVNDALVDGPQAAIITATASGFLSAASVTTVNDNDGGGTLTPTIPASATEGVGSVQGTVTSSVAPAAPLTVALASSDTTAVQVPAGVVIPAGQTSATFAITVVNDTKIDGTQNAVLTAHVTGWTDGTAPISVLDNENTNLTVSLPSTVTEGSTGTGTVSISGTLTSALTVSLLSDNTSRLTVPATVTIAAGSTSASVTLTGVNNSLTDGSAVANVSASAGGFTGASGSTTVLDNDVHHYTLSPIGSPQTRGVPFSVTIVAKDVNNATITSYSSTAGLTAAGTGGADTITPTTTTAFTSGMWVGNVTVNTLDTNVVLTANDGSGHTGASNAFNVTAGALHHFTWNTVTSPKSAGTPFTTTITAQDAGNNTVTSFSGTANLSALLAGSTVNLGTAGTTYAIPFNTIFPVTRSQQIHLASEIGAAASFNSLAINIASIASPYTLSNWTIRMKHTALSTWTAGSYIWETTGWTTVFQGTASPSATGWITFNFATPFSYDGTSNVMIDYSYNNSGTLGSQIQSYATTRSGSRSMNYYTSTAGDPLLWSGTTPSAFADSRVTDIRLGTNVAVPGLAPAVTGAFAAGVWTGNVTVAQAASQLKLRADDGASHTGDSNAFDVSGSVAANSQSVSVPYNTATPITLTGQDPANPGATLTYAIVTSPAHGALSGTPPNVTFTPTSGYVGGDSFTFTAANGGAVSPPATVSLTVQPPPPEIAVEQPAGTGLTDGVSTVAYGTIPIGIATTRTFTVKNLGTQDLIVTGITKDGTNSGDVSIGAISSGTIVSGSSATFDATFTAGAVGARGAAIHIANNDADESSFDITLTATGSAGFPDIALEQPAGTDLPDAAAIITFGNTTIGTPVVRTFTIRNVGAEVLNIGAITFDGAGAAQFVAGAPSSSTIAPAGSATLDVTFLPSSTGTRLAGMHIASTDPDESPFDLLVQGIGSSVVGPFGLMKDINTVGANGVTSAPVASGTTAYFAATAPDSGTELWKSDGTAGGTVLVSDVVAGASSSFPTNLTMMGSTLFFSATNFNSSAIINQLWKSDGTAAGTTLLKTINSVSSASMSGFTVVGSTLYFAATDGTTNGIELWKSDGTAAGTVMVANINVTSGASSSPTGLINFNGTLFFAATDGTNGVELWKSDGTSAGTVMVANINTPAGASSSPANFLAIGSTLYFTATNGTTGVELYKTDGTTAGTSIVLDINSGSASASPAVLTNVNGTLFFRATNTTVGTELWKSDGTAGGTVIVKDIFSGTSSSTPGNMVALGSTVYFAAIDTTANGIELWKSDGTAANTVMVANINATANGSSSPAFLTVVGSLIYFTATDGVRGTELWKTDGTAAGTARVEDIALGSASSSITSIVNAGGVVYLVASDGVTGGELWKSDGTVAGTFLLKDANPGTAASSPFSLLALGSTLFFNASDGGVSSGAELWQSNGTAAGTVVTKDIAAGVTSSSPANLTLNGSSFFFSAFDSTNGTELWKSDGTAAGTVLVSNIASGVTSSSPANFRMMGSMLFFSASDGTNGTELWKSDGTAGGTAMVANINPSGSLSSSPSNLTVVGSTLFFQASDGTNGFELWKSDGTAGGTSMVANINTAAAASSSPANLTAVGSTLFFQASDGVSGTELWKSDGTAGGTVQVKDVIPGSTGGVSNASMIAFNGSLFFAANDGVNGAELWISDGTTAGTVMLKDINPGGAFSSPANFFIYSGFLYFSASDTFGVELWRTDGTAAGTVLVKDINVGSSSSSPFGFASANGLLYFRATTAAQGTELWRTDGTAAGTQLVADIAPGTASSTPTSLTVAGSRLFFTATASDLGSELWSLDLGAAPEIALYEGADASGPERQDNVGAYNFGAQSSPTTRSFTLKNTGAGYLYVSDITISGANASSFVVQSKPDPSLPILPGATATFTVTATLAGPVSQSAAFSILCNDADEASFDVPVTVTVLDGTSPVISAPATYLIGQVGTLAMSLPDLRDIVVYSDNLPGNGTITQDPIPGSVTLAIGETVTVTFSAADGSGNPSNVVTTSVRMGLGQQDGGGLTWARAGSGVGSEGTVTKAVATSDGGAYVAGTFTSSPFTLGSGADQVTLTSAGNADVFVARFARDGTLMWARSGGGVNSESVTSLVILADGSVVVGGTIGLTATFGGVTITATTTDGFVARYLPDGTVSWAKGISGTGTESVNQLVVLGDGNIAAAGSFTSTTVTFATGVTLSNIGTSFTDLFFAKYDKATGAPLWVRGAGSSSASESVSGLTLLPTSDGGLAVAGSFFSSTLSFTGTAITLTNSASGLSDWWAGKFDTAGTLVWAKAVGGGGFNDAVTGAQILSGGDIVIAGTYSSTTATFGVGQAAQQVFANFSATSTSDIALVRLSGSTGLQQWAKRAGGINNDSATALVVLPDDSIALTGTFSQGAIQFGPGESGATILSAPTTSNKTYLARFNANDGTLRWAKATGGSATDTPVAMSLLWDGDVGIAGTFATPSSVFGPGEAGATTLVNSGTGNDVYLAKFDRTDGHLVWAKSGGSANVDTLHGMTTLSNGSVILTGSFQPASATFGQGEPAQTTLTNADSAGTNTDLFFARFNAGGVEPPAPPVITLLPPSGLSPSTMTFNASIDSRGQDTTVLIDYGATTSYGITVPAAAVPAGLAAVTRSLSLNSLAPLTTLHFQVRATNPEGTSTSADQTITTYPDAEISVEQPAGTPLTDGVSTVSFGTVPVGSSVTKTFTIRNAASATADLTSLALSKTGAAVSDYALGSLGATSLAPGASTTFDLTYTPSAGGIRIAAIQIASNDGDENPFDIALTGNNFLDAVFNTASDTPVSSAGYTVPSGRSLNVTLGFAPTPGTVLTVVNNTGGGLINGTFLGLPQGGLITATYGGQTYVFQASYFGGDGNNLVLVEAYDWTWMKGHSASPISGFGSVLGGFSPSNTPNGRSTCMTWTDASGSLWVFGGTSSSAPTLMNDMWKYDRAISQWAWMKGTAFSGTNGVYGTLGVAASTNLPGARYGGQTWTDSTGKLWLFGGFGLGASGSTNGYLNDLWRFDPSTTNWTWLGGSTAISANGTYGTQGTPSTSNIPGARWNGSAFVEPGTGYLWLFGGFGLPATGTTTGNLNDLWRYNPATGQWTWVKGGNAINAFGTYGTKGTPAAANTPGTRNGSATWTDAQGKFWVFGGIGWGTNIAGSYLGDLWRYDPATNMWTWMSGSGTAVTGTNWFSGTYGAQAVAAAGNSPGFRQYPAAWTDQQGRLWMHGGIGYGALGSTAGDLSDLWFYDIALNQWAWVKGPQSIQNNGTYGAQGVTSAANLPGARDQASAFTASAPSSSVWLFGGLGYTAATTNQLRMNDVWTLDVPKPPLAVTTLAATSIGNTSATLNGSANPNGAATSLCYRIGTAADLSGASITAAQNLGSGSTVVSANQPVSGLLPGTTYYFQAQAFGSSGVALGGILSFITTSPEIVVEQPAGAGLTDNVSTIAYGDAPFPGGSLLRLFTVRNTGTGPLGITSVSVNGGDGGDFAVNTSGMSSSVPVGGSTTFGVTFSPGALGGRSTTLQILTDDADEATFDVTLTGTGITQTNNPVRSALGDVVSGASAPGANGASDGTEFSVLKRGAFIAENGALVFPGTLLGPGVDLTNFQGIWKDDGSGLTRILRSGDAAPESGGVLFNILPDVPGINDDGDVTVLASLRVGTGSPAATAGDDIGVWSQVASSPSFRLLAREGDLISATGLPANTRIDAFESGCFATARLSATTGEAAFSVTFKGGTTDSALLRASITGPTTTAVSVVARENQPAGATGETFGYLNSDYTGSVHMDAQGGIVFGALLRPSGRTSVWYQPQSGGAPVLAVKQGDNAPNTTAKFSAIDLPSMGANGTFAFRGVLTMEGDNSSNTRNDGIWRGSIAGGLNCILRRGDDNTNRAGLFPAAAVTAHPQIKAGNIYSGWLTNNNRGAWLGWVDFAGDGISSFPADGVGIYTDIGGGPMNLVISTGDASPGIAGATMFYMDHPVVSGNSLAEHLAFIGFVTGGGTTAGTNDKGVWRMTSGGVLNLLLRTGASISTTEGLKTIADLDLPGSGYADHLWETPVMDQSGRLVINVTFTDGSTTQIIAP